MYEIISKGLNVFQTKLWAILFKGGFKTFGSGSKIGAPLRIDGMKNISIGSNVYIRKKAWLFAQDEIGKTPQLSIGDGTYVGHFFHAVAVSSIIIEKKVLIADKVFITDNYHGYEDPTTPVIDQPLKHKGDVVIGEGSWLGDNVCIVGVSVGKHSIVGANSVVTKDIPDYSIAAGSPAKVIKQYSHEQKKWVRAV